MARSPEGRCRSGPWRGCQPSGVGSPVGAVATAASGSPPPPPPARALLEGERGHRGSPGAVAERLQSGQGGCESGWGRRFLAVGNAVGAGAGVGECLWGRVSAVGEGGRGVPPPLPSSDSLPPGSHSHGPGGLAFTKTRPSASVRRVRFPCIACQDPSLCRCVSPCGSRDPPECQEIIPRSPFGASLDWISVTFAPWSEFCLTTQHLPGVGGGLTPPPPSYVIGQIFLRVFSQSKIFSGAFGASQFRPKTFFGASNNSGCPEGGGSPPQPHPPTPPWTPPPPSELCPLILGV